MHKILMIMIILLTLSACDIFIEGTVEPEMSQPIGEVGSYITISGTIVDTIDDCAFDGMCAFIIETDDTARVTVIWSEGDSPNCANDMFRDAPDRNFQLGDSIEAFGEIDSATALTTCGDEAFYIRKSE